MYFPQCRSKSITSVLANKVISNNTYTETAIPTGNLRLEFDWRIVATRRAAKSKPQKFARSVGGGIGLGFRTASDPPPAASQPLSE